MGLRGWMYARWKENVKQFFSSTFNQPTLSWSATAAVFPHNFQAWRKSPFLALKQDCMTFKQYKNTNEVCTLVLHSIYGIIVTNV